MREFTPVLVDPFFGDVTRLTWRRGDAITSSGLAADSFFTLFDGRMFLLLLLTLLFGFFINVPVDFIFFKSKSEDFLRKVLGLPRKAVGLRSVLLVFRAVLAEVEDMAAAFGNFNYFTELPFCSVMLDLASDCAA